MVNGKEFSRLMIEFGGSGTEEEEEDIEEHAIEQPRGKLVKAVDGAKIREDSAKRAAAGTGKLEGRLIVPEKRTTGSVSWKSAFFLELLASFPDERVSLRRVPEGRERLDHWARRALIRHPGARLYHHEQLHAYLVGRRVSESYSE